MTESFKDRIVDALKRQIKANERRIFKNEIFSQNYNAIFYGNVAEIENLVFQYCNENKINIVVVDLLNETNERTNLHDLCVKLNNNNALLYLKNISKVDYDVCSRFSYIYKNSFFCSNPQGIASWSIEDGSLNYLGTILICNKADKIPFNYGDRSCFSFCVKDKNA